MRHPKDVEFKIGEETPESAAHYIRELTEDLANLARRNGLDVLCYILEMARIEAQQVSKGYRLAA